MSQTIKETMSRERTKGCITPLETEKLVEDEIVSYRGPAKDINAPSWMSSALELRQKFLEAMGWKATDKAGEKVEEGDDVYDRDPRTVHYAVRNGDGEVVTSMRLTPCESPLESMTLAMLSGNPELQSVARQELEKLMDEEGWNWGDLTRLVSDPQKDSREDKRAVIEGIIRMLEVGFTDIPQKEILSTTWLYAVDEHFLKVLHGLGIHPEELVRGKASEGDEVDTVLCRISPYEVYQQIMHNPGDVSQSLAAAALRVAPELEHPDGKE